MSRDARAWLWGSLAFLALSLNSCGGGGGGSGGGEEEVDLSNSLAPKSEFTDSDYTHLLVRTSFGVQADDMARASRRGAEAWVDSLLEKLGDTDEILEAEARAEFAEPDFPLHDEIIDWWLHLMVRTENPFKEVLAFLWHDHFATSQVILDNSKKYWMVQHIEKLRARAGGNVRELLYEMATDWAMLRWLDGVTNVAGKPNENFAREFYELFSLGANNGYSEGDIAETARAFTGFRESFDEETGRPVVTWDEDRHDIGFKTIFGVQLEGRVGPDSYLEFGDVVDHALASRGVASWVTRRLFSHLCHPDPSADVIEALSETLLAFDWELKPVLRQILLSEAFYSPKSKKGFVRSPVEFAIGFVRTTGLEIPFRKLNDHLEAIGQQPTVPPSVFGWPEGEGWLTEQAMLGRANLLAECIDQREYQLELGVDIETLLPPLTERTDVAVVDSLAMVLGVDLGTAEREACVEYLNLDKISDEYTILDDFDGSDPEQIDKKVRGLLYILAQHPSYHIR